MTGRVVATVQKRGRFWAAEPYFPAPRAPAAEGRGARRGVRGERRLVLASNRVSGGGRGTAGPGDLVLVELPGRGGGRGRIVRRIGRPEVARDAIEARMLEGGLAREFSDEVEREAGAARDGGLERLEREAGEGLRRDLRELATFTIDPARARDFDDGISAERLPDGGVRVWVHIADVSSCVREGSAVDLEARGRGTSVYVPGTVEPMLPHALSSDACSLVPGRDRGAVTVELEVDVERGRVRASAFYRSLISSDGRLDYEQVDRIFAGSERAAEPWGAGLAAAREASAALAGTRMRAGGLALDAEEPEFELDEEGHVVGIVVREQTESHRLIEHLMIAANEAVARHLQASGTPCLYRVHERPEPARAVRLVEQLASLGVSTPAVAEDLSSTQAAELVGELSQRVAEHVERSLAGGRPGTGPWGGRIGLSSLVLRSLQQAFYSPKNIGHAGLRSECYCHFTSPIRRYPDLVCHRALLGTLGGPERAARAGDLGELGQWSSEREREAMAMERSGDDLARCFALEQALYEEGWEQTFEGEVSGVISAGAFVAFGGAPGRPARAADGGSPAQGSRLGELAGPLFEGMVAVRRMRLEREEGSGREWWDLNEQETMLRGERSGETLRIGDGLVVRVGRVDTVRGRVDLLPG